MSSTHHIVLVEDDREISQLVTRYLRQNDLRVTAVASGRDMDRLLVDSRASLIILDINLPGEDGLSICRRLRAAGSVVPILMLTAKGEDIDRILGLEMGADDYLTKPFNPRELLARIKAALRRRAWEAAAPPGQAGARTLAFGGWQLHLLQRELVSPEGTKVAVTGAEFDLLQAFCERPGRILSRDQLLDITQGRVAGPFERSIDVLVSRLRQKMEKDPREPELIKTVRSIGYLFTPQVEAVS